MQGEPKPIHNETESEGWKISINNKIQTTNFDKKIIQHCTNTDIRQYWCEHFHIPETEQNHVDWKTFEKATSYLSNNRKLFILKHSAGISATFRNTDKCPRCGRKDEHTEHVILCKGDGTEETFRTAFEEIETWLMTTTTAESRKAVTDLILEYRHSDQNRRK